MITYRRISTRDREYDREKELRNRVLRLPLGLSLSEQDLRGENEQIHLVAVNDGGAVIGCVLVAFSDDGAKIRQIAVDGPYRGRGIGSELLLRAEEAVRNRNIGTVRLHARVHARGFFEQRGYMAVSKIFTEVTIPHIAMEKDLASPAAASDNHAEENPVI
jgi:hypothetical protein